MKKQLPLTPAERQKRLRRKRELEGLCVKCAARRGSSGTRTLCRNCADRQAEKIRERREADQFYGHPGERKQDEAFQRDQLDRLKDGLKPVVIRQEKPED